MIISILKDQMSKIIAVLQPNYIPWKGYFDIIQYVDEFVFLDDVQYTKRDWRNRNKIKTQHGPSWLTVPVISKNNFYQNINKTKIDGDLWKRKHWRSLEIYYGNAKYYTDIRKLLSPVYQSESFNTLSKLNIRLTKLICEYIGIITNFSNSSDFSISADKNVRIIDLCQQTQSTTYLSGPSAQHYIDEEKFKNNKIEIRWIEYGNYPQYHQLWGSFDHNVSILDLLFNCGKDAAQFMGCIK